MLKTFSIITVHIGFKTKFSNIHEQLWNDMQFQIAVLFVEWVTSILHARKALELLESRNGLYVLYMDRVTGELAKHVGQVSLLQELNPDIINILFH